MVIRVALGLIGIGATFALNQIPPGTKPLWEQMATFGIVGAICAWLLVERWLVGGKEREARHALANAIQSNTMATDALVKKIEEMNRAMWNFVMLGSSRLKRPAEDTPPHSPKVTGG